MKIKSLLFICTMALLCVVQTGCKRTVGDVWEDAKTAGRQMGKGLGALTGQRGVSRQIACADDFRGPMEHEFIPLRDSDIGERMHLASAAQPMSIPGEQGSGLPGIDGFSVPRGRDASIFQTVHFAHNDYAILGQNRQLVSNVASYMNQNQNLYLFVEGHCDETGSAAYNLALGAKRANAVRNQLIKEGVDPERIHTISYGKERPAKEGSNPDALAANRRAEYKLYYQ